MTKNIKCGNNSDSVGCTDKQSGKKEKSKGCDLSSDNSENKECSIEECENQTPEKLACLYKNAVVEIQSEFILLGIGSTTVSGATPLGANTRADVILNGNGFFIKGHYIIAPAHLVLLPPSLNSITNRYPLINPLDSTTFANGQIQNTLVRASRILVSVFNISDDGKKGGCSGRHSFVYEADLVGVDGAGDIAVLKINNGKQWNACNPCINKNHPYFKFGRSRASKEGEKVYLIGDYISNSINRRAFNAAGAIAEGLISDKRYLDYTGWVLPECVLVSAPAYAFSSGLPILNGQGEVIAMQTTDLAAVFGVDNATSVAPFNQTEGSGFVSGPSEFFMRRVIKTIIKGTSSCNPNYRLETINDSAGSFYRYRKGYLGIAYEVTTGSDYDTTTDYTSGGFAAGYPRVRLSYNGEFIPAPTCKELLGIKVLGVGGANPTDAIGIPNGYWYVPGGTGGVSGIGPLPTYLPVSPLYGKINPGDIITNINEVGLGDLDNQIAPALCTWHKCPGDILTITYRRGGNVTNLQDNSLTENYDNLLSYDTSLLDYPPLLDYPWYAVNKFPNLSALPYPGFVYPTNQLAFPQLPALSDGAYFHPSI